MNRIFPFLLIVIIGINSASCRTSSATSESSVGKNAPAGFGIDEPMVTEQISLEPTVISTPTVSPSPQPDNQCGNSTPCETVNIPDPGPSFVQTNIDLADCSFGLGKFSPFTGTIRGNFSSGLTTRQEIGNLPDLTTDGVGCSGGGDWPAWGKLTLTNLCNIPITGSILSDVLEFDATKAAGSVTVNGCAYCKTVDATKKSCQSTGQSWEHEASIDYSTENLGLWTKEYEVDLISNLLLPDSGGIVDLNNPDNGTPEERNYLLSVLRKWLTGCLPCNADVSASVSTANSRKDAAVFSFDDPLNPGQKLCGVQPADPDKCSSTQNSIVMTVSAGTKCEAKLNSIPLSKIKFTARGRRTITKSALFSGENLTAPGVNQVALGQNLSCGGSTGETASTDAEFALEVGIAGMSGIKFTCEPSKESLKECFDRELKEARAAIRKKIFSLRKLNEKFSDFLNRLKDEVSNAVCNLGSSTPPPGPEPM